MPEAQNSSPADKLPAGDPISSANVPGDTGRLRLTTVTSRANLPAREKISSCGWEEDQPLPRLGGHQPETRGHTMTDQPDNKSQPTTADEVEAHSAGCRLSPAEQPETQAHSASGRFAPVEQPETEAHIARSGKAVEQPETEAHRMRGPAE
jgi:hypothetical protein